MKKQQLLICTLSLALGFSRNAQSQSWNLTGNAGTGTSNFVGTTDNQPLRFKVNLMPAGLVDNNYFGNVSYGLNALPGNSGSYNTAIGMQSLFSNKTGGWNVGIGPSTLFSNVDGERNTALGNISLSNNISGSANVACGDMSLYNNVDGSFNTAVGEAALLSNKSSSNLVAVGFRALYFNNTGNENTAIGNLSLFTNTSGSRNTAVGNNSLYLNTTGFHNTAVGHGAFYNNTIGFSGTAIGSFSLYNNTTGGQNVGVGNSSLLSNISGSWNVAVGTSAMQFNRTGNYNSALGDGALPNNTSGFYNTAVGFQALTTNEDGNFNTALGTEANVINITLSNTTAIGSYALVDASDKVRIGNTAVTSIGGEVSWTTFSDARYKKNVKSNVPGLEFIKKLTPVTYNLDIEGINKHYYEAQVKNIPADKRELWEKNSKKIKKSDNPIASTIVYTGFLAQEVEKTAKEIGYDFSGVDKPRNEDALYGLRYSEFIPSLVKAIQEQEQIIGYLNDQNELLKQQNELLNKRVEKLEQLLIGSKTNNTSSQAPETQLNQNIPNPFSNKTAITYSIGQAGQVTLILLDANGTKIKSMEDGYKQKGQYTYSLDGSDLTPGIYYYQLLLNGNSLVKKAIKL